LETKAIESSSDRCETLTLNQIYLLKRFQESPVLTYFSLATKLPREHPYLKPSGNGKSPSTVREATRLAADIKRLKEKLFIDIFAIKGGGQSLGFF